MSSIPPLTANAMVIPCNCSEIHQGSSWVRKNYGACLDKFHLNISLMFENRQKWGHGGDGEGDLEYVERNVSAGFGLNVVSTKRGRCGDGEKGMALGGGDVELLEIMVVGVGSLAVSKLVCRLHSTREESGEIRETVMEVTATVHLRVGR